VPGKKKELNSPAQPCVSGEVLLDTRDPPFDTTELRRGLKEFFSRPLSDWPELFPNPPVTKGNKSKAITLGSVKWGVYAFVDYDGEPIYVGQTRESLSGRVGRHLTNQRTDAVAMSVLDPYEVKQIRVWPLVCYQGIVKKDDLSAWDDAVDHLNSLERHIFEILVERSRFNAILNEKNPPPGKSCEVPPVIDQPPIITGEVARLRSHPDTRIARRSMVISRLAQVIAERELRTPGLRRTLATQAVRLHWLATERFRALGGEGLVENRSEDESDSGDE